MAMVYNCTGWKGNKNGNAGGMKKKNLQRNQTIKNRKMSLLMKKEVNNQK